MSRYWVGCINWVPTFNCSASGNQSQESSCCVLALSAFFSDMGNWGYGASPAAHFLQQHSFFMVQALRFRFVAIRSLSKPTHTVRSSLVPDDINVLT